MSDFVNYGKRGVDLPAGCKNLVDLIRRADKESPPAIPMATKGLVHLEHYVSRLRNAPGDYYIVCILGFDLETGVFLERRKVALSAVVVIKIKYPAKERAVRELFQLAGVEPVSDDYTNADEGNRVLRYPLPAATADILKLITPVLRIACDATDHGGLLFTCYPGTTP
jgi:hypothetical protein